MNISWPFTSFMNIGNVRGNYNVVYLSMRIERSICILKLIFSYSRVEGKIAIARDAK